MNKLLKVTVVIAIVVTSLTLGLKNLSADRENAVIEKYNGSLNLPDWIAYQNFVGLTKAYSDSGHGDHLIVKALGINKHTSEGASKVDYFESWFAASLSEINQEIASETNRIHCSGDWASVGTNEIVNRLDESKAARKRIYLDHYAITLDKLSAEERTAFLAYLEEIKKSTSHVEIDTVKHYGKERADEVLQMTQVSTCSKADSLIGRQ